MLGAGVGDRHPGAAAIARGPRPGGMHHQSRRGFQDCSADLGVFVLKGPVEFALWRFAQQVCQGFPAQDFSVAGSAGPVSGRNTVGKLDTPGA